MTLPDTIRNRWRILSIAMCLSAPIALPLHAQPAADQPKVVVDDDGTVHVPAQAVPMTPFLSPEGRAYMTAHLKYMLDPAQNVQVEGLALPRYMKPYLDRQRELFPTDRQDTKVGGVHAYVYTPKAGISDKNKNRVLIELHGGGFSGCWPGCAELESIPVSGLGRVKVVAVDYRQGPQNKFPAASEDVASVYRELLKTYRAENIGIFGCSAGGMLTAMSLAWFQAHGLPRPGAAGIFCAGAGAPGGGDADYTATPLGEARLTAPGGRGGRGGGYLDGVNVSDPLVYQLGHPEVLSKFPPTLIITGTRAMEMSSAIYTHRQLVKLGVPAELHVWEGLFHGFFYNPDVPESKDSYNVMVNFFDQRLGK